MNDLFREFSGVFLSKNVSHFYSPIGEPTGENAISLTDFVKKMATLDVRLVSFHFSRKDFEKWIRDVIGDAELAKRISRIKRNLSGESLRKNLLETAQNRIIELKGFWGGEV